MELEQVEGQESECNEGLINAICDGAVSDEKVG